MSLKKFNWLAVGALASILTVPAVAAPDKKQTFGPVPISFTDPCAVFNAADPVTSFTKVVYGETVDFQISGDARSDIDTHDGKSSLNFTLHARGDGIGQSSGIKYTFDGGLKIKAATSALVTQPSFTLNDRFSLNVRVVGHPTPAQGATLAQGAQDNATLKVNLKIAYANSLPSVSLETNNTLISLTCKGSPWQNDTKAKNTATRQPAGKGFGDPWNKYSWSTNSFNNGLVVGTKNMHFDYTMIAGYSDSANTSAAAQCYQVTGTNIPVIYRGLACAELYEAPTEIGTPAAADTRFADIWRLDYGTKSWTRVRHDAAAQGFRIMAQHSGSLYVGSDLGSFVAGVDLKTGSAGAWNFPGSRILKSTDGINYTEVTCDATVTGPCTSAVGQSTTSPNVNVSFRALASYHGKLYLGTFNPTGGELWSYDGSSWTKVKKFSPVNLSGFPLNRYHPAVTELVVFNDKLYVGLGGSGYDYLYSYDGTTLSQVANLPTINSPTNIGVLKLFASTKGVLFIGNVDFNGFYLQTLDTVGNFTKITDNGFGNTSNAYAWSMAEYGGRTVVGTFSTAFLSNAPRGSAELWSSDDNTNWKQISLPVDFGFWNYGLRTLTVANNRLYMGTASNAISPDLITAPIAIAPGTEVWSIALSELLKL